MNALKDCCDTPQVKDLTQGLGPIGCNIGGIDDNGNVKEFIMAGGEWWFAAISLVMLLYISEILS